MNYLSKIKENNNTLIFITPKLSLSLCVRITGVCSTCWSSSGQTQTTQSEFSGRWISFLTKSTGIILFIISAAGATLTPATFSAFLFHQHIPLVNCSIISNDAKSHFEQYFIAVSSCRENNGVMVVSGFIKSKIRRDHIQHCFIIYPSLSFKKFKAQVNNSDVSFCSCCSSCCAS